MIFPDFFDVMRMLGRESPVYWLIVDFATSARGAYWDWPEIDDLQMALLMGGPLDNLAAK